MDLTPDQHKVVASWLERIAFLFLGSLVVTQLLNPAIDAKRFSGGIILSLIFYLSAFLMLKKGESPR